MRVLHIDSSARSLRADAVVPSATRDLSAAVVTALRSADPTVEVTYRDLCVDVPPPVHEAWVDAAFGLAPGTESELSISEALIAEVVAADVLVLGVPMYNYSVPAVFKAWIDQVVRIGRTFELTPEGPLGLLTGKQAVVVRSSGTDGAMLTSFGVDFHTPYLRAILGFIGITDVEIVETFGITADVVAANKLLALAQIEAVVARAARFIGVADDAATAAAVPRQPLAPGSTATKDRSGVPSTFAL